MTQRKQEKVYRCPEHLQNPESQIIYQDLAYSKLSRNQEVEEVAPQLQPKYR